MCPSYQSRCQLTVNGETGQIGQSAQDLVVAACRKPLGSVITQGKFLIYIVYFQPWQIKLHQNNAESCKKNTNLRSIYGDSVICLNVPVFL